MKFLLALSCAATLSLTATHGFAGDIPMPREPAYTNVNADHKTLSEAKFLLEQISLELKNPVERQVPNTPPVTSAPTTLQTPAPEQDSTQTVEDLQISRIGDTKLGCGALSQEAMRMRDIIYTTQDLKDRAKMQSHGITAAGAIGSFLIGSVTGGVGLAVGGLLLDHNVGKNADQADGIQDVAEQRRTLMMGIFNAKGCEGPLEHAMQNPEIFDPLAQLAAIETAAGEQAPGYND